MYICDSLNRPHTDNWPGSIHECAAVNIFRCKKKKIGVLYFNSSQTNPVFLAFLLLLGHCQLQSGIQLRARTYKVVGHSISNVTNTQTEFVCVTQVIYIVQLFGGFLISFYSSIYHWVNSEALKNSVADTQLLSADQTHSFSTSVSSLPKKELNM